MEKFFKEKGLQQVHGVIMLNEMGTRKSVAVNSTNLTYIGLVDFGEEAAPAQSLADMADHGLVILFRPLDDEYTQPMLYSHLVDLLKGKY